MTRRLLVAAAATILLGLAGSGLWQAVQPAPMTAQDRVNAIAVTLRCPTCQGLSVADSDAPISQSMRAIIAEQLADGRTDAEIRGYFVQRYGDWILLSPPSSGLGWLVWARPVVGVAGGVGLAFGRSRRAEAVTVPDDDLEHSAHLAELYAEGQIALPQTPAGDRLEAALELARSVTDESAGPVASGADQQARRQIATALAAQRREAHVAPVAAAPRPPPERPATAASGGFGRRWAWASGAAVFLAVIAGVLLLSLAPRGPGDLPTGNLPRAASAPAVAAEASALDAAVAQDPGDIPARLELAARLLQAGDTVGARQHARTVLEQRPDQPDGLLLLGLAMAAEGAPAAPQTFQRYLNAAPPDHPGIPLARSLLEPQD